MKLNVHCLNMSCHQKHPLAKRTKIRECSRRWAQADTYIFIYIYIYMYIYIIYVYSRQSCNSPWDGWGDKMDLKKSWNMAPCRSKPEGIGFGFVFEESVNIFVIWHMISQFPHFELGSYPDFFYQHLSHEFSDPRIRYSGCRLGLWWCQSVFGVCTRTERRSWLVP